MDAEDLRSIFYVVGSIALILLSISIIAIFYLIIRIKRIVTEALVLVHQMTTEISDQSRTLARTWGRVTMARAFIRLLKLIF